MWVPGPEDVVDANVRVCSSSGGLIGISRAGRVLLAEILVESAAQASMKTAAAVLLRRIAQDQLFVDGNKRTALAVAEGALAKAGFELVADEDEIKTFLPRLKDGEFGHDAALGWIGKHARRA
ncbi:MAG TPA: hypothetical protein VGB18_02680 [Candidatus Thermoplasmatota archaeon]